MGARIEFELTTHEDDDDTVTVTDEARGSKDTLKQAKGNRKANDPHLRRVEIQVERTDRTTSHAGRSVSGTTKTVLSEFWSINVLSSSQLSAGASGGLLDMVLRNEWTGREAHVRAFIGGGASPGLSTSTSVGGDPVSFKTAEKLGFKDFDGVIVRYESLGVGLVFVGWEKAYLNFIGLGPDAQMLDVGGWNVGAQLKLGGGVMSGPLGF